MIGVSPFQVLFGGPPIGPLYYLAPPASISRRIALIYYE
jgi:hypothetical protein